MSNGLIFYDNSNPDDRKALYDTRYDRLKVHINEGDNRLKKFDATGGTALVSNGVVVTEEIYSVPHNLPFKPKTFFFIYCRDTSPEVVSYLGLYASRFMYIPDGPTFGYASYIYSNTDETHFRIFHSYYAPDTTPSKMPLFRFTYKYLIMDVPGYEQEIVIT